MTGKDRGPSKFPSGEERRKKRKEDAADLQFFVNQSNRMPNVYFNRYVWVDSFLDPSPYSATKSFKRTFEPVLSLGMEGSLRQYLETKLKHKQGKARFIEMGGIAAAVARSFTPGFFKDSMAVTLIDHRLLELPPDKYVQEIAEDKKLHHTVLEADLLKPETYEEIEKRSQGEKFDLLISRMGQGLEYAPKDPKGAAAILQSWYQLLSEDGIMLVQVPTRFNLFLEPWKKLLEEACGDTLEIRVARGVHDGALGENASVYIEKKRGAPDKLPFLDAATVAKLIHDETAE